MGQENKEAFNESVLLALNWVAIVIPQHLVAALMNKNNRLSSSASSKCLNRKHILHSPCACFQCKSLFNLNREFSPRALPCTKGVTDGNTSLEDIMDVDSLGGFWENSNAQVPRERERQTDRNREKKAEERELKRGRRMERMEEGKKKGGREGGRLRER